MHISDSMPALLLANNICKQQNIKKKTGIMRKIIYLSSLLVLASTNLFAKDFKVDGICYSVTANGSLKVTKGSDCDGPIVIPTTVTYQDKSYLVDGISSEAFYNESKLTSISIPESIQSIGADAFVGCSNLTSVTIDSHYLLSAWSNDASGGLKFSYVFGKQVNECTIGPHVTSVKKQVFAGCDNLTSVIINSEAVACTDYSNIDSFSDIFGVQVKKYTIGSAVTSIGPWAFYGCSNMQALVFASDSQLREIGNLAFSECRGLKTLSIPASVTIINNQAFSNCTSLTQVTFEGNACQNSINETAFINVGSAQKPVSLILPTSWDNEYLPEEGINWNGGYFASNQYFDLGKYKTSSKAEITLKWDELTYFTDSEEEYMAACIKAIDDVVAKTEVTYYKNNVLNCIALRKRKNDAKTEIETERDKVSDWSDIEAEIIQDCLDDVESSNSVNDVNGIVVTASKYMTMHQSRILSMKAVTDEMGDFVDSEYLQSLVATETSNINHTTDENTLLTNENAAIEKIKGVMDIYQHAFNEGKAASLGEMGTPQTGCAAVEVTKGDTTVKLYAPDKVNFIKITANE